MSKVFKQLLNFSKCILGLSLVLGLSCKTIQAQVISKGLIGYWPLDGHTQDMSSFGNHGIPTDALPIADRFGNANSAYEFDGVDDYFYVGGGAELYPKNLTINLWFKHTQASKIMSLFDCTNSNNGEWGAGIVHTPLQGIVGGVAAGTNNRVSMHVSNNNYADGNWHMVTLVYDSTRPDQMALYMDGCFLGLNNASGSSGGLESDDVLQFTSHNRWTVAAHSQFFSDPALNNGPRYFEGALDEITMYNRPLGPLEIMQLYSYNNKPFELRSDTSICADDSVYIKVPLSYQITDWVPVESTLLLNDSVLIVYPQISTQYFLDVDIGLECGYVDSILITVLDCDTVQEPITLCTVWVPDAFSPNEDTHNERFKPFMSCVPDEYEFEIYNRWGQLVFQSADPTQDWEGDYLGKEAPQAIYLWTLRYVDPADPLRSHFRSGTVTLLR